MRLTLTAVITISALSTIVILFIANQLPINGFEVVSWLLVLLFGIASIQFFAYGILRDRKLKNEKSAKENIFFSGFNLLLIVLIVCSLAYLVGHLIYLQAISRISLYFTLYSVGILIGNNVRSRK